MLHHDSHMQVTAHGHLLRKSGSVFQIKQNSEVLSHNSVLRRPYERDGDDTCRPIEVLEVKSPPRTGFVETPHRSQRSKIYDSKGSKLDKAVSYFRSRSTYNLEPYKDSSPELLKVEADGLGKGYVDDEPINSSARCRERPKIEDSGQVFHSKGRATEIAYSCDHKGVVNRCAFNNDSTLLLTVSGDCSCHLFRRSHSKISAADSWTKEATLEGHRIGVWGAAISVNDDFIFTVGGDGKIRFWLMGTKIPPQMDATEIRKILGKRGERSTGTQAEIFARLKAIMSMEEDTAKRNGFYEQYVKSERRWLCARVLGEEPAAAAAKDPPDRGAAFDCALHPSNRVVATAWGDGAVRIYRGARTGTTRCESPRGFVHERWEWGCVQTMRDHTDSVFRCCFDRDGSTLATASKDGTVWLYSARPDGLERMRSLSGHMGPVLGLSFHPGGRLIASGSCDSNVVMWFLADLEGAGATWVSIATLFGHEDYVKACCFRDDGQLLATASRDRTVRLWKVPANPSSAGQLRRFKCLEIIRCSEELACLQFGSDSQSALLVGGTLGGSVCFWNTDTCLKCAGPFDTRGVVAEILTSTSSEAFENVVFEDEGRVVPARPLTAMSDWSGMETPNHTVSIRRSSALIQRKAVSAQAMSLGQPVIYNADEDVVSLRFRTMDPGGNDDQSDIVGSKRIKDYTAETMLAKETLGLTKEFFSDADVKKARNIANALLQESGLKHSVKLNNDALIAVLENAVFLDSQSITAALSKCVYAIDDLIKYGRLAHRFPDLKRHKHGHRWHLGKAEVEHLIREQEVSARHTQGTSRNGPWVHSIPNKDKVVHVFKGKEDDNDLEPTILENMRGSQLAIALSAKTIAEAKRILGERILQLITPELTWTKDESRLAGSIFHEFLVKTDLIFN